jgi:hypothetical protein
LPAKVTLRERKSPLGRSKRRLRNNIEVRYEGVDCIYLSEILDS